MDFKEMLDLLRSLVIENGIDLYSENNGQAFYEVELIFYPSEGEVRVQVRIKHSDLGITCKEPNQGWEDYDTLEEVFSHLMETYPRSLV